MRPIILLTRPEKASRRFAAQLREALGSVEVVISPLLQISPLVQSVDLSGVVALVFTSAHAVPFGAPGMRCYCVGDATARAAKAAGMQAISAGSDATGLSRRILADGETGPLLHIRGAHSRGQVAQTLTDAGCQTREIVAYDQVARPLSDTAKALLGGESPVIVPVFSPRTAEIFSESANAGPNAWCAALSDAVAEKIENIPSERIRICSVPNAAAMSETVQGLMAAVGRLEG